MQIDRLKELLDMDCVQWTQAEDDMFQKIHDHFKDDFTKVATQMRNVFQLSKFTPQLCQYRWKYYLDKSINKSSLSEQELEILFNKLLKDNLYNLSFWFDISNQFINRTPSVLKFQTLFYIQASLNKINSIFSQNSIKKRYEGRIKLFNLELCVVFLRMGRETQPVKHETIEMLCRGCNRFIYLLQKAISLNITKVMVYEMDSRIRQFGSADDFYQMMECLIIIDTIYRSVFSLKPYQPGEQQDRHKMEHLQNKTTRSDQKSQQEDLTRLLYDETLMIRLTEDEIRLLKNSEVAELMAPYFKQYETQMQ